MTSNLVLPGPLRSLLRMAGVSQQAPLDQVLPLIAQNAALRGYGYGRPNEFLILLNRYLFQARELQELAGQSNTLRVDSCRNAAPLLSVLGYQMRGVCGQRDLVLETVDPQRAFLTVDSGFPLADLEEALQKNVPFVYAYSGTLVPLLFREGDWMALLSRQTRNARQAGAGNVLDLLLNDQRAARLYWAMSKKDPETRAALFRSPGLRRLLPFSTALDLYGGGVTVRAEKVVVPGGEAAEADWKDLAGASPENPGEFVLHLMAKDTGWLAAYFDVLSRLSPAQQQPIFQGARWKNLYEDFRRPEGQTEATRGIYRKDADLLLLLTQLRWDAKGEPHLPGNLDVWKKVFLEKTDSGTIHQIGRRARKWDSAEQVLDALVSSSRVASDADPLQIYLQLNELDGQRPPDRQLEPATVEILASNYARLSDWYLVFSEFSQLSDASIVRFVEATEAIDHISRQSLRGNTRGTFQANIGLWQVLARQGEIPPSLLDDSWQRAIAPFAAVSNSVQLFDAAQSSLHEIVLAATGKSSISQNELIDLLAGPQQDSPEGQYVRQTLAQRIRSVLEDQELASLDTLFALGDGLNAKAKGKPAGADLIALAGQLQEFELPRPIFTNNEKNIWAPAIYNSRHNELKVRTDLAKVVRTGSAAQLEAARGQLAPFLKDTLVGLNYAYYEPPDAQILHHNPLFVRSHDFTGISVTGVTRLWQTPRLLAAGMPAGGGAFLMGSLADLSYMLAAAEQDFIVPVNVQALIWKELVPQLLLSSSISRWWGITPDELHAAALYQQRGEELVVASAKDGGLQARVFQILSDRMEMAQVAQIRDGLQGQDPGAVVSQLFPADMFYLAGKFQSLYPAEGASWGPAGRQLEELRRRLPEETSWERLARDFGVPHPTLGFTYARGMLNEKPFPLYSGYSSRLFAESWDSSNLFWARLADEKHYSPVMLNLLVPELTRRMIMNIFATDLQDRPAVLRATRATGEEFRQNKIPLPAMLRANAVADADRKAQ